MPLLCQPDFFFFLKEKYKRFQKWCAAHVTSAHLLKQRGHLTDQTRAGALHLTPVPVGEEEVSQKRRVGEGLDDAVHEAGVSQVDQPPQPWAE